MTLEANYEYSSVLIHRCAKRVVFDKLSYIFLFFSSYKILRVGRKRHSYKKIVIIFILSYFILQMIYDTKKQC